MKHNESKIQVRCVKVFRKEHPALAGLYFSIPNGMLTSRSQARIAVAEGLLKGAADTFLAFPNGEHHGLFIEFKKDRIVDELGRVLQEKSYQSPEQRAFQACVEKAGYLYAVVRTNDEFDKLIENYLNEHNT